ncbi:hypothetical protein CMO92_02240 [Candidatus Woesearchaeota archaeon]|nr:hypothetical protein [Candidatus Woesearchaeota archaeon]
MFFKKTGYPEEDELVLCTITKIQFHSVFARLEEYGKSGMIHIAEVSPGRIRNIRDYVKEGKQVVCKVLRINTEKGYIDLSLRRVTEMAKRSKMDSIKQEQKAEKIIESYAEQNKLDKYKLYKQLADTLLKEYEYIHLCFEDVVEHDLSLESIGIPKDLAQPLTKLVKEKIKPKQVEIKAEIFIQSWEENGLSQIKETLANSVKGQTAAAISYLGGGKYKLILIGKEYKEVEKNLKEITKKIEKAAEKKEELTVSIDRVD